MQYKTRFKIHSAVVGAIFLVVLIIFFGVFTGMLQSCGVIAHVTSTQQIIQNYENFYQMNTDIKAMASNVKIAKAKLDRLKPGDPGYDQANIEYSGIQMNLNNLVSEYNSKSKMITRNLWKASDLPYQMSAEEVLQ